MNTQQQALEKGLSLKDINNEYDYDPYRNVSNLNKAQQQQFRQQEQQHEQPDLVSFDAYFNPSNNNNNNNNGDYRKSLERYREEARATIQLQKQQQQQEEFKRQREQRRQEEEQRRQQQQHEMNPAYRLPVYDDVNETNGKKKAIVLAPVSKKQQFLQKLRSNANSQVQPGNPEQQPKRVLGGKRRVNNVTKKGNQRRRNSSSSGESSDSTSETSSSSASSESSNSHSPARTTGSKRANQNTKSLSGKKLFEAPKEKKLNPAEQAEKLRTQYHLQGFHPYYDKEADVLGLACCTCCMTRCKKENNCCRGCANLISCPVYCWIFAIIPTLFLLVLGIVLLALAGAKIIK